ncbi:MAG TPA: glycosyltransferase [Acidimicrobiales bacterium]|jgi:UDP-N-acetylglucosamine:LPS N-acetylglucosamine transferase|nr:glycosyltransferase [Acidimicrobiales bacterium]
MGAGHDGAARTLAEQLRAEGHVVEVKDFLQSGPLRIGSALRKGYEFELRHVPSAYDATYRLWYRVPWLCPAVAWLVTFLTHRRVLRWIAQMDPWIVVSTYPLSTLCLGRLRRTGKLAIPAVNFITDFGVHPLWVHRGVDVNLTIHGRPAEVAADRTGKPAVFTGPAVSARFDPDRLPDRGDARRRFGLQDDQRAVLVVAGSWGVGNLADTWRAIAADGRFLPVVVCGRDDRLRRQVTAMAEEAGYDSLVLGWTDDMPALMAACDALVENAGGLTSLEAMRVGLPVVSFDPIAGHGVENTTAMDAAGVARLANGPDDLARMLAEITEPGPTRTDQIGRAAAMFRSVPAATVIEVAAQPVPMPSSARRRAGLAVRTTLTSVVVFAMAWAGLTTGVAMATEAGAGVAHPGTAPRPVAYVGVRLTADQLRDPSVVAELKAMNVTAVVDDATAEDAAAAIRTLVAQGVPVDNGGLGHRVGARRINGLPWDQALGDARAGRQISQLIDAPITQAVPGRDLTVWDLVDFRDAHTTLVVPNHVLHVDTANEQPIHVVARDIYLVDGDRSTPQQLATYLQRFQSSLGGAQLTAAPLSLLV